MSCGQLIDEGEGKRAKQSIQSVSSSGSPKKTHCWCLLDIRTGDGDSDEFRIHFEVRANKFC